MEYTDSFKVYPPTDIAATADMLDTFFHHVRRAGVTRTTLPAAVRQYAANQATSPSYMLTPQSEAHVSLNKYTMTLGGVWPGPWPRTLFYYDKSCQMAFVEGECRPRMLRDYTRPNGRGDFSVNVPWVVVEESDLTSYIKTDAFIEIRFTITTAEPTPFGLAYWDDLAGFEITQCHGGQGSRIISDQVAFVRVDVRPGVQQVDLRLERKRQQ